MASTDRRRPYLRIADDIRRDIAAGRYAVGEQLPVARELAERYGVAMMTISNALAVLRDDGLIETRQGAGSFVIGQPAGDADSRPEGHSDEFRLLSEQLQEIREHMRKLGSRLDDLESRSQPPQPER
ncbi:GntR family transcriptional regulator [Microbispora rosea]|uniref:GntR family transcriptional regulator n=1 Tax=Microbispora rosea TaxID=58117 RepID=UPI003D8C4520